MGVNGNDGLAARLGFDNIEDIKAYRDLLVSEIERYDTEAMMAGSVGERSRDHSKATARTWQVRKELLELNQFLMPYLYPKLRSTEYTGDGGGPMTGSLKVEFVSPDTDPEKT